MRPKVARFDANEEPIDGYVLVDYLGQGQFGEVWKARDKASGKLVAIKIIDLTHSPTALKELRAFKLVKNLNHPNLIPIFTARLKNRRDKEVDFDKADQIPKGDLKELVIAMGLGEKSLSQRLKEVNGEETPAEERQGLPVGEIIRYFRGAAKGIDFLNQTDHGLGPGDAPIVHCDIKPENMMIVSGEVQIADCGVAVIITPDVRRTQAAGSPAYSAPELSGNKPVPGTDQYSLAVSYYEMRTGRLPFPEGASLQQIFLAHALGDLDFSSPTLSEGEREILKRATARVAAERYELCEEFIEELASLPEIRTQLRAGRRGSHSRSEFSNQSIPQLEVTGSGSLPGTGSGVPLVPPGAEPRKSDQLIPPHPAAPPPAPSSTPGDWRTGPPPTRAAEPAQPKKAAEYLGTIVGPLGNQADLELPPSAASYNPTPVLSFPQPRSVPTSSQPVAERVAPAQPVESPPADTTPPRKPGARDTKQPGASPTTETPRAATSESGPGARPPGVSSSKLVGIGLPVDPNDPLGPQVGGGTIVPDAEIQKIIAESQRIPILYTNRPGQPTEPIDTEQPLPATPRKVAPVAKEKPESKDRPKPVSKPEWPTSTVPGRPTAESLVPPSPDGPGPVPPPPPTPAWLQGGAEEAVKGRKTGVPATKSATSSWKQEAEPATKAGGSKIPLAMLVGVVGVVGVGIAVYMIAKPTGDSGSTVSSSKDVPPPTPPTGGDKSSDRARFDTVAADNDLSAALKEKDYPRAKELIEFWKKGKAPATPEWIKSAQGKVAAQRFDELIAKGMDATTAEGEEVVNLHKELTAFGVGNPDYDQKVAGFIAARNSGTEVASAWRTLEEKIKGGRPAEEIVADLNQSLGRLSKSPKSVKQLISLVVNTAGVKYSKETPLDKIPPGWGDVADIVVAKEPYSGITSPETKVVKQIIARWKAADLYQRDILVGKTLEPFRKLAVYSSDEAGSRPTRAEVSEAERAIQSWRDEVAQAKGVYGLDVWPPEETTLTEFVREWREASARKSPVALNNLKTMASVAKPPVEAGMSTLLVLEYFRLAGGDGQIESIRQVRASAERWKLAAELWSKVEAAFQGELSNYVRASLQAEKPNYEELLRICGSDAAFGWAKAAAAEDALNRKVGDPVPLLDAALALKKIRDTELARFADYLRSRVADRDKKTKDAAELIAKVYSFPPTGVFGTAVRKQTARDLLLRAAGSSVKPMLTPSPHIDFGSPKAVEWLALASKLGADDRTQVMFALSALAAKDNAKLRDAVGKVTQPIRTIPELSAEERVLFGIAQLAAGGVVREGTLLIYGDMAGPLIDWQDREQDRLLRLRWEKQLLPGEQPLSQETFDKQKASLIRDVEAVLDGWEKEARGAAGANPSSLAKAQKQAYARVVLQHARFHAKFVVTFEGKLAEDGRNATTILDMLGKDTDDELDALAGFLAFQRLQGDLYNDFEGVREGSVPEQVRETWDNALRLSQKALEINNQSPIANRVIGQALYYLITAAKYQWVHSAAREASSRAAKKYEVDDTGKLLEDMDRHLDATIKLSGRPYEAECWFMRGHALFHVTSQKALTGLDREKLRESLLRAIGYFEKATQQHHQRQHEVFNLRGLALEDVAWQTAIETDNEYTPAFIALKEAVAAVAPQSRTGKPQPKLYAKYLTDLGRCQYRAAAFGKPGTLDIGEAIETLTLACKEADQNDVPIYAAESYYWLGMAYWTAGKFARAAETLETASGKIDKVVGGKKWNGLAIYQRGRLAADQIRRQTGDKKQLVEEIRTAEKKLNEFIVAYPGAGVSFWGGYVLSALIKTYGDPPPANISSELEDLADKMENAFKNSGDSSSARLLCFVEYVDTLTELVSVLAENSLKATPGVRARHASLLRRSMADNPWLFTREERTRASNALNAIKR